MDKSGDSVDWAPRERLERAYAQLAQDGVPAGPELQARLAALCVAIREVRASLSLVSERDLDRLEEHVVDSLSLVPWVARLAAGGADYVDLGTGGGFPGLVVACALPAQRTTLVERGTRKAAFLERQAKAMGLTQVRVAALQFPAETGSPLPRGVVTARAVEKPAAVHASVRDALVAGGVFMSQRAPAAEFPAGVFHVEQIADGWSAAGLRRGTLWKITRRG